MKKTIYPNNPNLSYQFWDKFAQTLKGHIYDLKPTSPWWEQPLPTSSTATRE